MWYFTEDLSLHKHINFLSCFEFYAFSPFFPTPQLMAFGRKKRGERTTSVGSAKFVEIIMPVKV